MVGADLTPYPYISGYGLALRIVSFSLPIAGELVKIGFANRRGLDVLLHTQRPGKSRNALAYALGLQDTTVMRFWSPETWSPLDCPKLFDRHPRPLRQCPACARHGYHCGLFQLPSITRCPWHGHELSCHCPSCGQAQFARFNEAEQLGVCRCSFSALDARFALIEMHSFPAKECDAWASDYLLWASGEKQARTVYVSEASLAWEDALV